MPGPLFSGARAAFLVALTAGSAAPADGGVGTPPRAVPTPEAIRAAVAESRQRLKGLRVEYTQEGPSLEAPDPKVSVLRRVVVAAGARRRVESWHRTPVFPEDLDINHNVVTYDGSRLVNLSPPQEYGETFDRTASWFAFKTRCEYILECTGWWPPDDDPKTPYHDDGFFLHEALADPQYRVLPEQEEVDGAWCHVVDRPGVDRLWLDPAVGFSLRRRRWQGKGPGTPLAHYDLSGYREVAPGVWFPRRLRRAMYEKQGATADRPGRVLTESTAVVTRIEVNRDFGADLTVVIPPGTYVLDYDTFKPRVVPGSDLGQLDRVIERERSRGAIYAKLGLAPGWPSSGSGGSGWWPLAGSAAVVLSCVGLAFLIDGVAGLRRPARREPRRAGPAGGQVAATIPPGAPSL